MAGVSTQTPAEGRVRREIEEAPQFGGSVNTDGIPGLAQVGESVKIVLDIDKVPAAIRSVSGGSAGNSQAEVRGGVSVAPGSSMAKTYVSR